jgi:DNA-binding response OmpR family regulator
MKILLVDDDVFLRDMYATKFTEKGHEIESAETAEIALTKLHETTYDVLLTDSIMPGMTGIELLTRIQSAMDIVEKPACIMLSNQSDDTDKEAAFKAGAIGYIVKAELIPSEVVAEVLKLVSK